MESVFSPREIPTPTIETDLWMHRMHLKKKKVNYYVNLFKGGPDPKAQVPKHPEARECFVKYADSQTPPRIYKLETPEV